MQAMEKLKITLSNPRIFDKQLQVATKYTLLKYFRIISKSVIINLFNACEREYGFDLLQTLSHHFKVLSI